METRTKTQNADYLAPRVKVINVIAESIICQSAPDYEDAGSINFDEIGG
ncbi:MAG: hypothetical protein MJZ04_03310 [Bacteroidales bacterium]|nr:hypothetical protein [Bacteroidales bacterium]